MTATTPARIEDVLALSPLQAGLHSLAALTDGVDVYTMQFVIALDGADVARLRSGAQALLDRHPNLRVSIWDRDVPRPVQIVPEHVELPWSEVVVEADAVDDFLRDDADAPFALDDGPLLRATHLRIPGVGERLVFTAHHILMDGWSMAVFFRELIAFYNGTALPPAPLFRDYIAWLAAQNQEEGLGVWAEHLDGAAPTTVASGPVAPGTVPGSVTVALDADETAQLLEWSRRNGLTPAAVTATAWATVLGRLTDRDDVVFGATVAGRPEALAGVESMIGLFINTVPQRVRLDPEVSPAEACRATQTDAARMRTVGHLPLADITRQAGGSLFDTLFVFENAPIGDATATVTAEDGAQFTPVTMRSLAHYPLSVVALVDSSSGSPRLTVVIESVPELAIAPDPAELGERVLQVLRAMPTAPTVGVLPVTRPGDLPIAVPSAAAEPFVSLPDLFADLVRSRASDPALATASGATLTYGELGARVGTVVSRLRAAGLGAGDRVGLALERDEGAIAAILAVLSIGAAYVPLAADLPDDRIAAMLARSGAATVLIEEGSERSERVRALAAVVPLPRGRGDADADADDYGKDEAEAPAEPWPVAIDPEDPAYVIFTSGSTGEPKGVIGTHGALAAYRADHVARMYAPAQERLGRALRVAHGWSLSFDASWQPLLALFSGHLMRLLSDAEIRDAQVMIGVLRDEQIDMIDTSPSLFGQLAAAGLVDADAPSHLRVLALGGEAIPPHLWERLAALPETAVYNCYGPTETTVEALIARVTPGAPRIGAPTVGTRAYVLDRRLRPVPAGAAGELYLGGAQLTAGYAGRRDLTAARFVADPFAGRGSRMYRTGDLVRLDAQGRVVFLGRADDQVKVRGYRIELGDVESAIVSTPGVSGASVIVVRRGETATLVGFAESTTTDATAVRAATAQALPGYMVPARIEVLDRLPLTRNGKIDSAALAVRADALFAVEGDGVPPTTATERAIAAVCAEVWPGAERDVHADFFDLGLDSILAIAAVGRLRRAGLAVSPRLLMANPTIATLAAALDATPAEPEPSQQHSSAATDLTPLPLVRRTLRGGGFARYAQAGMFTVPAGTTAAEIHRVLDAVIAVHPALRARIVDGRLEADAQSVHAADLLVEIGDGPDEIDALVRSLDAGADRLLAAGRIARPGEESDLLVLAVHHLLADGVSWQILCEDIAEVAAGGAPLTEISTAAEYAAAQAQDDRAAALCVDARLTPADVASATRTVEVRLDGESSARVAAGDSERILRDAMRRALEQMPGTALAVTTHGRDDGRYGTDTTRTVGWFTTHAPATPADASDHWAALNYLGRRDVALSGPWLPVLDPARTAAVPAHPEPSLPVLFPIEVLAVFVPGEHDRLGPVLAVQIRYLPRLVAADEVSALARSLETTLSGTPAGVGHTVRR